MNVKFCIWQILRSNQWWGLSLVFILRSMSSTSNKFVEVESCSIADGKYIGVSNEFLKSIKLFKKIYWILLLYQDYIFFWGLIVLLNVLVLIFGTGLTVIWNGIVSGVATYILIYIYYKYESKCSLIKRNEVTVCGSCSLFNGLV